MKCIVYPVSNIRKHPNNDKLYIANVGEHQIITGSEPDGSCHYYEGQLGFFIPEGAIIPDKLAEEMWVKGTLSGKSKNVVKSKNRNGVKSDGLFYGSQGPSWDSNWKNGDEVSEAVGIEFTVATTLVGELTNLYNVLKSGEPLEEHYKITEYVDGKRINATHE